MQVEQKEDNIWKQILQKASKEKFNVPSKTVLMVGEYHYQKKKTFKREISKNYTK